MERFKNENETDRDQKILDRKARFGNDASAKLEKGSLEFSLDDYKSAKPNNQNKKPKFKRNNGFKDKNKQQHQK